MNESANQPIDARPAVRVKSVTSQQLVVGQTSVATQDWGIAVEQLLEGVWKLLNTFDDLTVGPAMARLVPAGSGKTLVEAGFPVAQKLRDVEPFQLAQLSGGEAATLLLQGPYERLPEAQAVLEEWLKREGRAGETAPWLIFWATPDDVQFPSDLRTELVWPIKPH